MVRTNIHSFTNVHWLPTMCWALSMHCRYTNEQNRQKFLYLGVYILVLKTVLGAMKERNTQLLWRNLKYCWRHDTHIFKYFPIWWVWNGRIYYFSCSDFLCKVEHYFVLFLPTCILIIVGNSTVGNHCCTLLFPSLKNGGVGVGRKNRWKQNNKRKNKRRGRYAVSYSKSWIN